MSSTTNCDGWHMDGPTNRRKAEGKTICPPPLHGGDIKIKKNIKSFNSVKKKENHEKFFNKSQNHLKYHINWCL